MNKSLYIFFITFSVCLGSVPLTLLEVEDDSYLIVSEATNEISMVDLSNQKWLRNIIYSGNPVEVRYEKGSCNSDFSQWTNLKKPKDISVELETKLTTHFISIKSDELKEAISKYKDNNEDIQLNFYDGKYWSCYHFDEILNQNSMLVLADSYPSTFCGLLSNETYWNDLFSSQGISCDENYNLTKSSFEIVQGKMDNQIFKEPDVDNCLCNGKFENYCRLNESSHFIGICSGPYDRVYGKTFYDSGTIFQGSYREDNSQWIGLLEWDNGNKIQGEFNINPEDYELPPEIDPSKHIVIGQYLLGTITSRGFFVLNEEGYLVLTGYGTKFNTDTSEGWTYQGGLFENDELSAESLMTFVDEEKKTALWFDVSKGSESKIYIERDGIKSTNDTNLEKLADGWDQDGEAEVERITAKLTTSKDALERNFQILEERKEALNETESKAEVVIKPLSSETTASIQALLAALGYETGKVDGILGRLTIAAIKAFQSESNLEVTGRPTEELLISLQTAVRRSKISSNSEEVIKLPIVSTGTGFYIQESILVTNNHVVDNCSYLTNKDGNLLTVETTDTVNDIAILAGPENLNTLPLSFNPNLGMAIYTGGFPYNDLLKSFNFTSGNVSSLLGPGSNISEFQFSAPIQPGSSGGAILNEKAGVVGITVSSTSINLMLDTETIPQNINFGIKVEVLKDILKEKEIDYEEGNSFWFKSSQEDVAKLSKDASIVINCHASK